MHNDLEPFFRLAKSVHLHGDGDVHDHCREDVLAFMEKTPVRDSAPNRLNESMETPEFALASTLEKRFAASACSICMLASEKSAARNRIEAYMRLKPAMEGAVIGGVGERKVLEVLEGMEGKEGKEDRHSGFFGVLMHPFSVKMVMSSFVALIIVAVSGGGLAFASDSSLPGDMLYPFKVYIAENIMERFQMGPEAKAWWEAQLAERRLEELEELAVKTKLRAETSALLASQFARRSTRVRDRILLLQKEGDFDRAAELMVQFESSLQAHHAVLSQLTEDSEIAPSIYHALQNVEGEVERVRTSRERGEAEVDVRSEMLSAVTKSASQIAERQLRSARALAEKVKGVVNAEEYARLHEKLDAAEKTLESAIMREEGTSTDEAYQTVQSVLRDAKQAERLAELRQQGVAVQIFMNVPEEAMAVTQDGEVRTIKFRITSPLESIIYTKHHSAMQNNEIKEIEEIKDSKVASSSSVTSSAIIEINTNAEVEVKSGVDLEGSVLVIDGEDIREEIEERHEELRKKIEDRHEVIKERIEDSFERIVPGRTASDTMPVRR